MHWRMIRKISRPICKLSRGRRLSPAAGNSVTTSHRYNLAVSLSMRNILNHNNPGPIIGNITSPLFGRPAGTIPGILYAKPR